ncbi:MAG: thiol:disulfide interchange protein [Bacteroidales bacterium]|nr:thiol:disulfide interchange protein [Bacteroidales bacterium]
MGIFRYLTYIIASLTGFISIPVQAADPVEWTAHVNMLDNENGTVVFNAFIKPGWHLYGFNMPEDGPAATSFSFSNAQGITFGQAVPSRQPNVGVDMIFHLRLNYWENEVVFTVPFKVNDDAVVKFDARVNFQTCNNSKCMPPRSIDFSLEAVPIVKETIHIDNNFIEQSTPIKEEKSIVQHGENIWQPVVYPEPDRQPDVISNSGLRIFMLGFLGGLLALMTPCVWPIIPLTMSLFSRYSNWIKIVLKAFCYGFAIIIFYVAIGLAMTWFFGVGSLSKIASSPWFNLAFFVLLVLFAISFFGAFEITLPAKLTEKVDRQAEKGAGLVSIFFMALALAFMSFSCTGPIIGTLLLESVSMGMVAGPILSLGGFAVALALPFMLFAIFPAWLRRLPRAGSWFGSINIFLGFIELALSIKFLSVADMAFGWNLITRETFISIWVAIFAILTVYLLGIVRFPGDNRHDHVSVFRVFLAVTTLSLTVYLLPGLFGMPLKGVSAIIPQLYNQNFNSEDAARALVLTDYKEALKRAKTEDKPVLIEFYAPDSIDCIDVEENVLSIPEVSNMMFDNFVVVKLNVDDTEKLPHKQTISLKNRRITVSTYGELWTELQDIRFGSKELPYFVIVDSDGHPLEAPYSYKKNPVRFAHWLKSALTSVE